MKHKRAEGKSIRTVMICALTVGLMEGRVRELQVSCLVTWLVFHAWYVFSLCYEYSLINPSEFSQTFVTYINDSEFYNSERDPLVYLWKDTRFSMQCSHQQEAVVPLNVNALNLFATTVNTATSTCGRYILYFQDITVNLLSELNEVPREKKNVRNQFTTPLYTCNKW